MTLEWQVTDKALLYALAAKGVKPAGIGLIRVPIKIAAQDIETFAFLPEEMWSYEIGAKTEWNGSYGDLLFNTAMFYQDYSDKQTVTQQEIGGQVIGVPTNASAAWVKGVELETTWFTPLEGLSLGLGYTWLDSEYDDFIDSTRSVGRIALAGDCSVKELKGGRPHCVLDLSGNVLEQMPENSVVLTARYEGETGVTGWTWFLEGNASWQDERYTSSSNFTILDDYWLADARLGAGNDNWEVIAYMTNVFDDNTISSSGGNSDLNSLVDLPGLTNPPDFVTTAFLPPPRTVGLRVRYRF